MKRIRFSRHALAAIGLAASLVPAVSAQAAIGDIDTTFGGPPPGFAINNLGGDSDVGFDLVTGRNDRLYSLGLACDAATCVGENSLVVSRFAADGSIDATFGTGGDLVVANDITTDDIRLEVDDENARIYLAFPVCNDNGCALLVSRRTFTGALDATYGTGGTATIVIGSDNLTVIQALLQPNGKLLVLLEQDGFNASNALIGTDIGVVRLNTNGTVDTAWGNEGLAQVGTPTGCDLGPSMTIGRAPVLYVTAAQSDTCAGPYDAVVTRLNALGQIDTSFGTGGRVIGNLGQTNAFIAFAAQEQTDGKIAYALGYSLNPRGAHIDIVKLNNNGSQDTGFTPEHGEYIPVQQFTPVGNSVFQSNGKIVFNGHYTTGAQDDQALNRIQGSPLLGHPPRFVPGVPFVGFATPVGEVSEAVRTTTVTVTLTSAAAQTVTLPFSLGGSATRGVDYELSADSFVIPAGATSGSVIVTVVNDGDEEFDDTILLILGNAAPNANTAPNHDTFILTLTDNDFVVVQPPPPADDGGGTLGFSLLSSLFGLAGLRRLRRNRA